MSTLSNILNLLWGPFDHVLAKSMSLIKTELRKHVILYQESWPILKGPRETLCIPVGSPVFCMYFKNTEKRKKQRKQHLLRQTMSNCVDPDNVSYLLYRHCPSRWVMLTDFSFHGPPCREWKSNLIHIDLLSNCWVQLLWPGLKVLCEQDNKFFLHKAFSSAWETNS